MAATSPAIRRQVLEMPAPVLADALGCHNKTTTRLRKRDRRDMEPIRRWRSHKVTGGLDSSENRRQLIRGRTAGQGRWGRRGRTS